MRYLFALVIFVALWNTGCGPSKYFGPPEPSISDPVSPSPTTQETLVPEICTEMCSGVTKCVLYDRTIWVFKLPSGEVCPCLDGHCHKCVWQFTK